MTRKDLGIVNTVDLPPTRNPTTSQWKKPLWIDRFGIYSAERRETAQEHEPASVAGNVCFGSHP
jgi:hypothetical protein